tara:strand:- start:308 stop:490 length:183 start_codon:yes stop_codon:yes gene_type:complete
MTFQDEESGAKPHVGMVFFTNIYGWKNCSGVFYPQDTRLALGLLCGKHEVYRHGKENAKP